jgi:hypothetical protein
MAIAFRAVSAVARSASATSVTVDKPSGTAEGDLLLAQVKLTPRTVTGPSGWQRLLPEPSFAGYPDYWYKVAGASEPSTYQWTWSGGTSDVAAYDAAQSVAVERLADRVKSTTAVFRDGRKVGEVVFSLTDSGVLRVEWSGEPLRGFEAWARGSK